MKDVNNSEEQWAEERYKNILSNRFRQNEVLFCEQSAYQKVEIIDTLGHGRMLFTDNAVMLSERDEFIYHEMIAHVPMFVNPAIEKVLVIGGGDGGTVRELLHHPGIREIHLVEIDELVISACKRFIPQTASCLDDPRVVVSIMDGVQYVAEAKEVFDLVIVDSSDPVGPAEPLFSEAFYRDVANLLSNNGIVISQAESPFYEMEAQKTLLAALNTSFKRVNIYNYCNLTYPGGLWSFSFASKTLCPIGNFDASLVSDSGIGFKYYNARVHQAAFMLPEFLNRELELYLTPLRAAV